MGSRRKIREIYLANLSTRKYSTAVIHKKIIFVEPVRSDG